MLSFSEIILGEDFKYFYHFAVFESYFLTFAILLKETSSLFRFSLKKGPIAQLVRAPDS